MVRVSTALALTLAIGTAPAAADEVEDVVEAALSAYREGDAKVAREELEYALKLLNEMKAAELAGFLPEPQSGWSRGEDSGDAAGFMGMFGGGSTASATYSRGTEEFTITLIADSPMVNGMAAMFSGVAPMGAGNSFRIQRQQFAESDGTIQGVVGEEVLVTIEGDAPIQDVRAHLEAMDMSALAEF